MRTLTRLRWLVFSVVMLGVLSKPLSAQVAWSECNFARGTSLLTTTGFMGQRLIRVLTPRLICPNGTRIQADSAQVREIDRTIWFWGDVRYFNATMVLTAPFAVYFEIGDSLRTSGGSRLEGLASGSFAEAPVLTYRQAGSYRTVDTLELSGGRTHTVLHPQSDSVVDRGAELTPEAPLPRATVGGGTDSSGVVGGASGSDPGSATQGDIDGSDPVEPVTYDVVANNQVMIGEETFHAWGDVVITRDSLVATADSAHIDQLQGVLFLRGGLASISLADRELVGQTITVFFSENEVREVIARRRAELSGNGQVFSAPNLIISVVAGEVEDVVGVITRLPTVPLMEGVEDLDSMEVSADIRGDDVIGDQLETEPDEPGDEMVARVTSSSIEVRGDSVHIFSPGGIVERMFASGNARLDLVGRDSLNTEDTPALLRRDWTEADTITTEFVEIAPDSTGNGGGVALERLEAYGNVRALFRMMPPTSNPPPEIVVDSLVQIVSTTGGVGTSEDAPETPLGPGDTSATAFSVHYIAQATALILEMVAGELSRLEIEGPAHVLVLEPEGTGRGGLSGGRGGTGAGGIR